MAKLADRLGFDLADTFASDAKGDSDLFEGAVTAVIQSEAQLEYPSLPIARFGSHSPVGGGSPWVPCSPSAACGLVALSGGAVNVRTDGDHLDVERLPDDESLQRDRDRLGPIGQRSRDVQLDTVLLVPHVPREGFSLEIGVDRHLGTPTSANRWNEVDGCDTAAVSDKVQRFFADLKVHQGRRPFAGQIHYSAKTIRHSTE